MRLVTSWQDAVVSVEVVGTLLCHERSCVAVVVKVKLVLWTQCGLQQLVMAKDAIAVRHRHFPRHALAGGEFDDGAQCLLVSVQAYVTTSARGMHWRVKCLIMHRESNTCR